MSCQKLTRQSLYLVLNASPCLYPLSRMDVSRLFYPTRGEAQAAQAKAKEEISGSSVLPPIGSLPMPHIFYQPFTKSGSSVPQAFSLLGKDRILCSDADGCTSMYYPEVNSFVPMPKMSSYKGPSYVSVSIPRSAAHARSDFMVHPDVDPILFANRAHGEHTDSLYIMNFSSEHPCSFECLAYYPPMKCWSWRSLPPPPFFDDPDYLIPWNDAVTVVNDTMILVSTNTATYSFDTVALKWSKVGDWALPFLGKAEYDTELGTWLGLSIDTPNSLCAIDLSTVDTSDMPPVVKHIGQDVTLPENWDLRNVVLVNLGLSRFCIAKFFDILNDYDEYMYHVVVFTGVEVVSEKQELKMFKHKSECIATACIDRVF